MQKGYDCYQRSFYFPDVTIPDTIINLAEVETITIRASVQTLPTNVANLKKLQLLDLTGCYSILSLLSELLAMHKLKIKIGNVISPASEVVITHSREDISHAISSVLSDRNKGKIS